jgi:hypothetical protein
MIFFKIIIISLYLFFLVQEILINTIQTDIELLKKRDSFVKMSRFFSSFALFLGMNNEFRDIKLVGISLHSKKVWYLRKDEKIGNFYIGPHFVRQHLAFNYTFYNFNAFMNDYFKEKIEAYFYNCNDQLLSFEIFSSLYSSFETDEIVKNRSKPIKEELIFSWKLEDKNFDERFRYI